MRISLRQLEIFVAITNAGNLSRASTQLYLSQSALSMALINLEQQLGGQLFDRYGKQLRLNSLGELLLPKALSILDQAKEFEDTANKGELQGQLTVGASTTMGNYLLPVLIAQFMTQNPKIKIALRVNNTELIIQELLKFTIDIGIIEGNCHHPDVQVTHWRNDELLIVASPQHPLAKKTDLYLADLLEADWILREEGSGTREVFTKAIGNKVRIFLELGHTEAIIKVIETGLGISCLPKLALEQALRDKRLTVLTTPFLNLTRGLYLVIHKQKYVSPILAEFIRILSKLPLMVNP